MQTRSADGQAGKRTENDAVKEERKVDGDSVKAAETKKQSKENLDDDVVEHETADVDHAESLRRKRDREGSIEPSLTPSKQETIPTKKNRLQSDLIAEESSAITSSSPPLPSSALGSVEGEKVGQIRKRVEDLSWKQRKEGDRDRLEAETEVAENDAKEKAVVNDDAAKGDTENTIKSSQPTFASFSTSKGFAAAVDATKGSTSSSAVPARTQPTFSSFSKSSSPFGSASASIAGPSWLAGKGSGASSSVSSSAATSGGLKPSALGIMPGSTERTPSASATKSVSPPPSTIKAGGAGKGLGFGAFASTNAFGKASASRSSTPSSKDEEGGSPANGLVSHSGEKAAPVKTFDEALREGELKEDVEVKGNKVTTQFDKGQADLRTGEEDEMCLASIRAKLFTMGDDKSWKERGTGTVRCNVDRHAYEGRRKVVGARLVMRSEGVLRLILNVKLFKGMKVILEQDKFLRMVAFEDGKATHFAIRMGNAAAASQFTQTLQSLIPKEEANGTSSNAHTEEHA